MLAILTFIPISGFPSLSTSFTNVTVAAYVVLLGLFMCCTELNIRFIQQRMRVRCGCYFTFIGRAVMIFFAGSMALALGQQPDNSSVPIYYILGGATCANALFNVIIILCHPAVATGEVRMTSDPWEPIKKTSGGQQIGAASMEDNIAQYLKENPQLVSKALASGVGVATATAPGILAAAAASNSTPANTGGRPQPQRPAAPARRQSFMQSITNPFRNAIPARGAQNTAANPAAAAPEVVVHPPPDLTREESYHLGSSFRGDSNPFA